MVSLEVLTAIAPPPLPPDWAKYWGAKSSEEILAELLPMLEGMGDGRHAAGVLESGHASDL